MTATIELQRIRSAFPSLASGFAFCENAGGSQVPEMVASAIRDYMLTSYVQLGATYPASRKATETVREAHEWINRVMNGEGIGHTIFSSSSTQLLYMLAECYARAMKPGDEVIICETAHEANAGPWAKLADRGFTVKIWKIDLETLQCPLESLEQLLTERTKIVAFPQVSNLLGEIVDVRPICDLAHRFGARVVVDGVAYAPHRAIDVKAWDCDWYVYSCYKVYGPHMGALFGKTEAFAELMGPNHFFIPDGDLYKFELGGVSHEGCAGLLALRQYFNFLCERDGEVTREVVEQAFEIMTELELPLQRRLVSYLLEKPGVRVIGPQDGEASRISTISFVSERRTPAEIVEEVVRAGIGIRSGHMYAYRLCRALGIDVETGVVRVSFVHYNTPEEVERLIAALERVL